MYISILKNQLMKKLILLILISFFSINSNAQKKKKATTKISKTNVLAKTDNVSVEIFKNNFNLYIVNGKVKDSINIKSVEAMPPTDCTLKAFTTKGIKMYLLTYNEKSLVQNPNKTEDIIATNSEIFDVSTKTKVYSNIKKTTKITEKVFLDRLKNASETQEKMRNEGYTFTLLPDGDISLSSKTKSSKLSYDLASKQFIESKKKK